MTDALELLRSAGFKIWLDYDDELMINSDDASIAGIVEAIKEQRDEVVEELRFQRKMNTSMYVGGSMSGKQVHYHQLYDHYKLVHIGRARWEVYVRKTREFRKFFVGEVTSKVKAKALALRHEVKSND